MKTRLNKTVDLCFQKRKEKKKKKKKKTNKQANKQTKKTKTKTNKKQQQQLVKMTDFVHKHYTAGQRVKH